MKKLILIALLATTVTSQANADVLCRSNFDSSVQAVFRGNICPISWSFVRHL
jgi:hypothetical protein